MQRHSVDVSGQDYAVHVKRRTVNVSGENCAVQVNQVAKNVWIADGEFRSDRLRARGSTAGKAVRAWCTAAVKRAPTVANSSVL